MVTIEDLERGRRVKLTPREYAQLRGCSQATLARERWRGNTIPFQRDEVTARIYYAAADVLAALNRPKYHNTSQYPHDGCLRMEKARAGKSASFFD